MTVSNFSGIEESNQEWGKLKTNRGYYLNSSNLIELHIHPSD
jgi:hypothetical protein